VNGRSGSWSTRSISESRPVGHVGMVGMGDTTSLAGRHWSKLPKRGKRPPLERCHIVPEALGGATIASNTFLLCRDCHRRAPDTTSAELFIQWTQSQNYQEIVHEEFRREWLGFGLSKDDFLEFSRLWTFDEERRSFVFDSDFEAFLNDNISDHFDRIRGPHIKPATYIAAFIGYRERRWQKAP
jgi:hypothetical protein